MTDLNHTMPMTEEDMNKVRSLFERGADAIVNASKLAREVNELRQTMSELKQSYEEVVANNRFLVRQINALEVELTEVKKDRDEARLEVSHHNQRMAEKDDSIAELRKNLGESNDIVARLTRESDDHMMRALQAEEKVSAIESKVKVFADKVAEAQTWFTEIETLLHPEEVEPLPEGAYTATVPEGVTVVPLDTATPEELHNAIAEAVEEPTVPTPTVPTEPSSPEPQPWQRYGFGA